LSDAGQSTAKQEKATPTLEQLKRRFDESRCGMEDTRKLSEAARDYFDGKQLTAAQRRVLRLRKQPDVVVNRTRRAVEGILGVVEQGKTDPRAYMRNPPKPTQQPPQPQGQPQPGMPPQMGGQPPEPELDAGDVASMTLRYVADTNQFQQIKMDALENMFIEGYGGAITEWLDGDVKITLIPSEEYFYDVKSRKADFADKRFDGVAKWMYADDLKAIYKDKAAEIDAAVENGDAGSSPNTGWEDKPDKAGNRPWADKKAKRLMVVEMYYKENGQWGHCVFHSGGFLDECAPSMYVDDKGRPMNPIETQAIYVARDLLRYGVVKDMIDVQDEINARRSKAIHEINTRQIQCTDLNAPPVDVETVRKEAARPDGVIPMGWQVVPRNDVIANSIEMMTEAKSELERLAPNPAILGRQSADASGRSVQLRQQAGMVELARPLGRFTSWESRIYHQVWSRVRQFYDEPKWVRVTNDDGAAQYVQINEPTPPQPQMDPATGQVVMVPGPPKNHVAQMDVDIIVDSVPDTATLEQEIFNELVQLAKAYGPEAVPFDVLVEMSPLPKRREIVKKLEKARAANAQSQAPAQQMEASKTQAQVNKDNTTSDLNVAKTNLTNVQATVEAMEGHLTALSASAMPQGHTLDSNDQHVPLQAPPPTPPQMGPPV
jgi:hypothetical protein